MKLLVVTYNALMTSTANGRTMISLLEGYSADEISNFCVTGIPDKKYCSESYRVTNLDALKSLILFSEKGGAISPRSTETTNEVLDADLYHGNKTPFKYYLRELTWKLGRWKGKRLKTWLREQNFDCVVYMYGDGAALQDFSVFVSNFLKIPLVVYSCEEYCFKDFNYINRKDNSFFFKKYLNMSKNATSKLLAQASALICNTDLLGKLYCKTYELPSATTIMMASDMEFVENTSVPSVENMKISYCGSLGIARAPALVDIAEALHELDSRLTLDVYGRSDEETAEIFSKCPALHFHGFVSYDEVQKIIRKSNLLIQTNTLDGYYAKDRRFGFSTKNADSLACGTPYFLYENEEIVEMHFVKEHDCAFVATTKEELVSALKDALFDEAMRKEKVANAKKVTDTYFNRQKNIQTVHKLIEDAITSAKE